MDREEKMIIQALSSNLKTLQQNLDTHCRLVASIASEGMETIKKTINADRRSR